MPFRLPSVSKTDAVDPEGAGSDTHCGDHSNSRMLCKNLRTAGVFGDRDRSGWEGAEGWMQVVGLLSFFLSSPSIFNKSFPHLRKRKAFVENPPALFLSPKTLSVFLYWRTLGIDHPRRSPFVG